MEASEIVSILSSKNTNLILIACIVGCIILLLLFRWSFRKWLKWFYIPTLFVALLFVSLGLFGKSIIETILSDVQDYGQILLPFVKSLTTNFMIYGIVLLALGIVAVIVDIIIKKKKMSNDDKNF